MVEAQVEADRPTTAHFAGPRAWPVGVLVFLITLLPSLQLAIISGPAAMTRRLTGDAYQFLAIARKSLDHTCYTYDGVTATNGFHPLWQYFLTQSFEWFELGAHQAQAMFAAWSSLLAIALGVGCCAAAIVRATQSRFLGLLTIPGVYYLLIGAHYNNQAVWDIHDGMESGFAVMFGGLALWVLARRMGAARTDPPGAMRWVPLFRDLGLIFPFLVLSRLDDIFLIPAFVAAALLLPAPRRTRMVAALWVAVPTAAAVVAYMGYNLHSVGSALPLSGLTKAGLAVHKTAYITAALHCPPLLELKAWATGRPSDGAELYINSFRVIELVYPAIFAIAYTVVARACFRARWSVTLGIALCGYIVLKAGYCFLNVRLWHQSAWYFSFATLSLSYLIALLLAPAYRLLAGRRAACRAIQCSYVLMMMLTASAAYYRVQYFYPQPEAYLWNHRARIEEALRAGGVNGLVNFDDGITAFLIDMPFLHGFAFAADPQSQQSCFDGRMLTLAARRDINGITGFGYMDPEVPPRTDAEIRAYLRSSIAGAAIGNDLDQFHFELAFWEPEVRFPVFRFEPIPQAPAPLRAAGAM